MSNLVKRTAPQPLPLAERAAQVEHLEQEARGLIADAKAIATQRAYRGAWRAFEVWCQQMTLPARPASPSTAALYLTHLLEQGRGLSTLVTAVAAISHAHELSHLESPCHAKEVRELVKGARRRLGGRGVEKKRAAILAVLYQMIEVIPSDLRGARDRALVLVGFGGAFRRSELVALDVQDAEFSDAGVVLSIRRSKTDQEGKGKLVAIPRQQGPHCPVRALSDWMAAAGIESGPIFRKIDRWGKVGDRLTSQSVALVVKRLCKSAGLDPAQFAGHSLRSGFITSAAMAKKPTAIIMQQSRHKHVPTFFGYVQRANIFEDNAATGLMSDS